MSVREYLAADPLHDIVRYRGNASDSVAFVGTLRKHPYDQEKCLLFTAEPDAEGQPHDSAIYEFRVADVLGAEEMSATVDTQGKAMPRARLYIRKGAIAARYEPFEVGAPKTVAARPAQAPVEPQHRTARHHGDAR